MAAQLMVLKVGICTNETGDAEYVHFVKFNPDKEPPLVAQYRIIDAIETLYANEGVLSYTIASVEDEEGDNGTG